MCLIRNFFSLQVSHLQCHAHHPSTLPSLCYLAFKKKKKKFVFDKLHVAVQVLNPHQFKRQRFYRGLEAVTLISGSLSSILFGLSLQ